MRTIHAVLLTFTFGYLSFAQIEVSGEVTSSIGETLPAVTVLERGTSNATLTDFDGLFSLSVQPGAVLEVSYLGYEPQIIEVGDQTQFKISLNRGERLEEVVILGNQSRPRTILDSPVPIDNIKAQELVFTGKPFIEDMLRFAVPSYQSLNHYISDGTAHYDPADLRGLGPSRTLVLINGKRKGQAAQILLNRNPGKGDVGVDMKSIPVAAIERVEVLRDGASAQYGSDAIAGVMNIILKEDSEFSTLAANTGITSEGDGFNIRLDFNHTLNFGNGGKVNFTLSRYIQELTNRAGSVGERDVIEFHQGLPQSHPEYNKPRQYELEWARKNPRLGMHVGQPEMDNINVYVNLTHPIGENAKFYTVHGHTYRYGKSFAYYRAPYWRKDVADSGLLAPIDDSPELGGNGNGRRDRDKNGDYTEPIFTNGAYIGYQPTFETKIVDDFNLIGIDFDLGQDLVLDLSASHGNNKLEYIVNNSVNRDYLADHGTAPHNYYNGGYNLRQWILNADFSKLINDQVSLAWGTEYRTEIFSSILGDPFSFYEGGSDSFGGINPDNLITVDRNSFAAYGGIDLEFGKFLVGGAGRFEEYSDFGNNFSWKVHARQKLGVDGTIRASYSTGFRAPALHQRHLENTIYIIVANSPFPVLQGTLSNDHPAVKSLGVSNLFAETSNNIAAGLTYRFSRYFSASLDLYQIDVNDRILFSSQISAKDGEADGLVNGAPGSREPVEQILVDNDVVAIQFFLNAGNTRTRGADVVFNLDRVEVSPEATFSAILAANFNSTQIQSIDTPQLLEDNGYDIFDKAEEYLLTDAKPKSKINLGLTLDTRKYSIGLNNTQFGVVTVPGVLGGIDQELSSKVVTDVQFTYKFNPNLQLNLFVNNIFDVYPDVTDPRTNDTRAGNRFTWSNHVQQHGTKGLNFAAGLNYRF